MSVVLPAGGSNYQPNAAQVEALAEGKALGIGWQVSFGTISRHQGGVMLRALHEQYPENQRILQAAQAAGAFDPPLLQFFRRAKK